MAKMSSYRDICLETKGEACTICGATKSVVVHHVDGDRSNNDLDNLEPVCRSCHEKIHAGAEGYRKWFEQLQESARAHVGPSLEDRSQYAMYLSEDLQKELNNSFERLNAQRVLDDTEKVEKHRHFLEGVVRAGLDHPDLDEYLDPALLKSSADDSLSKPY